MPNTDWIYPASGLYTMAGANPDWINPINVIASDDSYSTTTLDPTFSSDLLVAVLGSGNHVPNGAVINGIEVKMEWLQDTVGDGDIYANYFRIISSGYPTPLFGLPGGTWSDHLIPLSEDEEVFGGPTDLWGSGLSPFINSNIINGGYLTLQLQVENQGSAYGDQNTAYVDSVSFKFYYDPPLNESGVMNLFTHGFIKNSGELPLFIHGGGPSKSLPLFIGGGIPSSGQMNLYEFGVGLSSGELPVFIHGMETVNNNVNLFTQAREPQPASEMLPIYMYGSSPGSNGQWSELQLYLQAPGLSETEPTAEIPLYLSGSNLGSGINSINMFIGGEYQHTFSSLPLFMSADSGGNLLEMPLYISGYGLTDGGSLFYDDINLYLERSTGNSINLYLRSTGEPNSSGLPIYIMGVYTEDEELGLSIPNIFADQNSNLRLVVRGF